MIYAIPNLRMLNLQVFLGGGGQRMDTEKRKQRRTNMNCLLLYMLLYTLLEGVNQFNLFIPHKHNFTSYIYKCDL